MISKRIFIAVTLVILVGGTAAFFISKNNQVPEKAQVPTITPTPTPATMLTWVDEAGFSFLYPEGTDIDSHPEDNENYANLTLTLPSRETVSIIMSDNTFKDLDDWAGETSAIDTTLEGRPAKRIVKNGLETIACIDNEVIVEITGKEISEIINSWTFIYPTTAISENSTPSVDFDENVLEEE